MRALIRTSLTGGRWTQLRKQALWRRAVRRLLRGSEVTESAWPCSDPECVGCQLSQEDWSEIQARLFAGEDVYVFDHEGWAYPVYLKHVTSGPDGLTEMLGLVKLDARSAPETHSHTLVTKARH